MLMELRGVSYAYPCISAGRKVLTEVDLQIAAGDFLALIGPSGAGKSTLLLHLNGLLKPSSGEVLYQGKDIHGKGFPLKKLRSRVGMLFQYPENNFFAPTVYEDIAFGPQNLGKQGQGLERAVSGAMYRAGVPQSFLDRSPFSLSGGEKRRVALAGVLAMQPEMLVLDEPTAGLDPVAKDRLMQLVQELYQHGTTIVLVSHELDQVSEFAKKTVVLNEGRIVAQGSTRQILVRSDLSRWNLEPPQVVQLGQRLNLEYRGQPVLTEEEGLAAILHKGSGRRAK